MVVILTVVMMTVMIVVFDKKLSKLKRKLTKEMMIKIKFESDIALKLKPVPTKKNPKTLQQWPCAKWNVYKRDENASKYELDKNELGSKENGKSMFTETDSLWELTLPPSQSFRVSVDFDNNNLYINPEPSQENPEKLFLLAQQADPPFPVSLSKKIWKILMYFFCISDYSEHFLFFMKIYHFNLPSLGVFRLG